MSSAATCLDNTRRTAAPRATRRCPGQLRGRPASRISEPGGRYHPQSHGRPTSTSHQHHAIAAQESPPHPNPPGVYHRPIVLAGCLSHAPLPMWDREPDARPPAAVRASHRGLRRCIHSRMCPGAPLRTQQRRQCASVAPPGSRQMGTADARQRPPDWLPTGPHIPPSPLPLSRPRPISNPALFDGTGCHRLDLHARDVQGGWKGVG